MKKILLLVGFILIYPVNIFAINPALLKGTHDIFPCQLKFFAPVFGLTFAECSVLENIYDLSSPHLIFEIKKEMSKNHEKSTIQLEEKEKVDQYLAAVKKSGMTGTERLVRQMFTRIDEDGPFSAVTVKSNPVSKFNPEVMGRILRIVYKIRLFCKEFCSSNKDLEDFSSLQIRLHSFLRQLNYDSSEKNIFVNDNESEDGISAFFDGSDNLDLFYSDRVKFVKSKFSELLKKYLMSLKLFHEKKEFTWDNYKKFIDALFDSLDESDENTEKSLYSPGTTEGILLAFMLKKANTKADLEHYFNAFLGRHVDLSSDIYSKDDLHDILEDPPDFNTIKSFGDWISAIVFERNYCSTLPRVSSVKNVMNRDRSYYSDSIETVLHDICNIVTHDIKNGELGSLVNGVQFDKKLSDFYSHPLTKNPLEVDNQAVHQAWALLLENRIGLDYEHKTELNGSNYRYKLKSTFANFLIVLNDLFNLNLYENLQEVSKESSFVVKYLPQAFMRLGVDFIDLNDALEKIDNFEKGKISSVKINLRKGKDFFSLNMRKKNSFILPEKDYDDISTPEINEKIYKKYPVQTATVTPLLSIDDAFITPQLLFYYRVINLDDRSDWLEAMIDHISDDKFSRFIAKSILTFAIIDPIVFFMGLVSLTEKNNVSEKILRAFTTISRAAFIHEGMSLSVEACLDSIYRLNQLKNDDILRFIRQGLTMDNKYFALHLIKTMAIKNKINEDELLEIIRQGVSEGNEENVLWLLKDLSSKEEKKLLKKNIMKKDSKSNEPELKNSKKNKAVEKNISVSIN